MDELTRRVPDSSSLNVQAAAILRLQRGSDHVREYYTFRAQLWDLSDDENRLEAEEILSDCRWAVFLAHLEDGNAAGFLEVRLREYAEGASSSPVGYIEGWYVAPEHRSRGIGRMLVEAAEIWARSQGCSEMASNANINNIGNIEAHGKLGYGSRENCVFSQASRVN